MQKRPIFSLAQCTLVGGLTFFMLLVSPFAVQAREALEHRDIPGLYERILTLPGAKIYKQPKAGASQVARDLQPPTLTPMYVYERKSSGGVQWLACGKKPKDGVLGWIQEPYTEIWKMQLVAKLTPKGSLSSVDRTHRVVYYKDFETINRLMSDEKVAHLALKDLKDVKAGRPDLNRIVAVEPETPADPGTKAYIMPVIGYKESFFYDENLEGEGTAFEVAMINRTDNKLVQKGSKGLDTKDRQDKRVLKDFKIGLVFVMDTTASMTRYIDLTRETVREVYKKLEKDGTVGNVTFGLVGYRDYVNGCANNKEFVTQVYQPLDPKMKPESVLKNLEKVKVGSTCDFKEDMYAGLKTAVDDLDWRPFKAGGKFIVVITDASAREPGDPQSQVDAYDAERLRFVIDNEDIQVFPLYLRTPDAEKRGDFKRGKAQFEDQERTEWGQGRLQVIDGGNKGAFQNRISQFTKAVSSAVEAAVHGRMPGQEPPKPGERASLEDLVVNEIFKAQMKYLGRQTGAKAPAYYRGWVSKVDLTKPAPRRYVIKGHYLLTRNQLNDLSKRMQDVLALFDSQNIDLETFRRKMLDLSAKYGTDPNLREIKLISETGVLPPYLAKLPYKSEIMGITGKSWVDRSQDLKLQVVENLKKRLFLYKNINQDYENWIDLGEGQEGLKVFPIPIEYFP